MNAGYHDEQAAAPTLAVRETFADVDGMAVATSTDFGEGPLVGLQIGTDLVTHLAFEPGEARALGARLIALAESQAYSSLDSSRGPDAPDSIGPLVESGSSPTTS